MAASGKDESLVWNSASGGAFYLLARYILSQDGYVCGAVLDKNLKLCHVLSNRVDEIEAMRGSKYIPFHPLLGTGSPLYLVEK